MISHLEMFGFAQSAEKLQLYQLFLLENNKDANQNCQYTLTFMVLCRK